MGDLNLTNTLTAGTPEDVNDVQQNFTDVVTWANGNIDSDNFTATTNQNLGLSETGTVRRGKSIIATQESRSNTAYGTLTTPDQVSNIILPTDGLLTIHYYAEWFESVSLAARAAIFIGSNQLKIQSDGTAAAIVSETAAGATAGTATPLSTNPNGLASGTPTTSSVGVTTGQVVGFLRSASSLFFGGPCVVFAAAGTYTVSVQFKASSGSVTARNRHLWVRTEAYG